MKVNKVVLFILFLVLFCLLLLPKLQIGEVTEEASNHWIQIQIRYPGADVYSVEKEISIPMEEILKNVGGYLELESISIVGKSTTYLSFPSVEILRTKKKKIRNLILEKMDLFPTRANRPEITASFRDAVPSFVLKKNKSEQSGERSLDEELVNEIQKLSGVKYIQKSFHTNTEILISFHESISQILQFESPDLANSLASLDFGLIHRGDGPITKNLKLDRLDDLNDMYVDLPNSGRYNLGSISTVTERPKEKKEETRVNGEAEELLFVYIDKGLSGFFLETKLKEILKEEPNFKLLFSRDSNFNTEVLLLILVSLFLDISIFFTKCRKIWAIFLFYYYGFFIISLGFFSILKISLDLFLMTGFVFLKIILWLRFIHHKKLNWLGGKFHTYFLRSRVDNILLLFFIFIFLILNGIFSFPSLFDSKVSSQNQLVGTLEFPPGKVFKETDRITKQVESEILKRKITEQMIVQSGVDHSKFYLTLIPMTSSEDFSNLPSEEGYFHLNQGREKEEEFVVSFFGNSIKELKKNSVLAIRKLRLLEGVSDVLQMYKEFVLSQVGTLDSDVFNDLEVDESMFYQDQKISMAQPVINKVSFREKLTDIRIQKRQFQSSKFNFFGRNKGGNSIPISHFIETENEEVPDQIKRKNQNRVLELLVKGKGISEDRILQSLAELKFDSMISTRVKKRETGTNHLNLSSVFTFLFGLIGLFIFLFHDQKVNITLFLMGIFATLGVVAKICSLNSFEFNISLVGVLFFWFLEKKKCKFISRDQLGAIFIFLFVLLCIPWGSQLFRVLFFFFCFHFIFLKFGVFLKKGDQS